ncbi:MAG: tetratricopeptide repeat protein, partial [Gemmatimonadetes bacterium]|nr:tetratricopeptide repeat protein [Gemmatimonadota bacterium]
LAACGRRDEAAKELERVLVLAPNHPGALIDLAVLALSRGQATSALERLSRVVAAHPAERRALFYQAVALEQVGRCAEAKEVLEAVAHGRDQYAVRARARLLELARQPGGPATAAPA